MVISRTPYRISFLGGGSDYPTWYREHGGCVLGSTIDRYCYLTCRYLPPFFDHKFRVVYSLIEDCKEISEIQHPVVREVLRYLEFQHGLEIHHDGDLPARSGIGSSSSFTVGLLHALKALRGEMSSKGELAQSAIHIEQERLQENVGVQDQILASYGGLRHVEISPSGEYSARPVVLPAHRLEEFSSWTMLFFTGIKRLSSDVAATYVTKLDQKAEQMHRVQRSVGQGVDLLLGQNLKEFGRLLHESWLAKKSLSPAVSRPEIDEIYDEALAAGAVGGKILGAGGGGFMLLIVPPEKREAVRARLHNLICVPFSLESSGSQVIYYEPEKIEEPI